MLACKHFKLFGLETELEPSTNPWNAWITVYDEKGDIYYRTFRAGGMIYYLYHLLDNYECRREIDVSLTTVKRMIRSIERELNDC